MSEHCFTSIADLDAALSRHIAAQLSADIEHYGQASLVVSGGSTPAGLFRGLSETAIDWARVSVLLADERWVGLDHADSNEAMVRTHLLTGHAAAARFISLIPAYPDQMENLEIVTKQLAALQTFSVVVLGMGGDMHTASLFPCCPEIESGLETDSPVLMTHPVMAPHARISLSRKRLLDTRVGVVHIVGDNKWSVLESARSIQDPKVAPVSAFLPPAGGFEVWWAGTR